MARTADRETAYFTLLRAREEATTLRRYEEHLRAERVRLDAFSDAVSQAGDAIDRRVRRPLDATAKNLLESVGRRRAVVLSEQARLPERQAAADDFVAECKAELESLQ